MTITATTQAWIWLCTAGFLEIAGTTAFRYTDNFTRPAPTGLFALLLAASFYCTSRSLASIPLGTAYAVWTGIGAAGTVLVGIAFYQEPVTASRLAFLSLLIGAIIGLKFVSD